MRQGEVMAVLESRELSDLKSEFLAQKLLVKKIDTGIKSRQAVGTITRGNLQAYGEFLCRTLPEELCDKLISNLG